jgi:ribosomal protein S15
MRGRKGEEKQVSSEESAPDSGSSYLSQLTMRGLKARTDGAPAESPLQKLGQLSRLGDMNQGPGYMFLPPKEHLIERYYADEHLSSMERHKIELQKVREEYRIHEGDCGSSQVQIALLTAKIKYMAEHMKSHKKDFHSRKGLEGMIEQRKKLLKYLRRTDWDEYCVLITRLGLRDRPNEVR